MKPDLKRIEAAMEEAACHYSSSIKPIVDEFVAAPDRYQFTAFVNSALAKDLLTDLQVRVREWTAGLEELVQQIQAAYHEGPIIDGWLESSQPNDPAQSSYRLCGLDEDGQIWYRDYPAEQIPDISLAIARYQRLRTLLNRKQHLEAQLSRLTQALVEAHEKIAEATQ
jgi:hypothetical protein